MNRPNIFDYESSKVIVQTFIEHLRARGTYSNKKFARICGLGSHTYIHLIMKGERVVTDKSVGKLAKGFELSEAEEDYFRLIVRKERESDPERRARAARAIMTMKNSDQLSSLSSDIFDLVASVELSEEQLQLLKERLTQELKEVIAELKQSPSKTGKEPYEIKLSIGSSSQASGVNKATQAN